MSTDAHQVPSGSHYSFARWLAVRAGLNIIGFGVMAAVLELGSQVIR